MATRSVDKNGKFSWKHQKVFLSGSLAGWEVGLQGTEKGQLEVWFGRLLLGHQAFSQRTGPGRLWISLDAGSSFIVAK